MKITSRRYLATMARPKSLPRKPISWSDFFARNSSCKLEAWGFDEHGPWSLRVVQDQAANAQQKHMQICLGGSNWATSSSETFWKVKEATLAIDKTAGLPKGTASWFAFPGDVCMPRSLNFCACFSFIFEMPSKADKTSQYLCFVGLSVCCSI